MAEGRGLSLRRVKPLMAELLSIYFGLKMMWRMNYKDVALESNLIEAVKLLLGREVGSAEDCVLIQNCKELVDHPWVVQVKHIFREANRVPDWLAKWAMR